MKLLLVKIGKAWSVIRRDGILRGSRRVLTAFGALFRRVAPGDVLFISNGVGDSARYRTTHVAEELRHHGVPASVTTQDNPFLLSHAATFSVFVFHRVVYTDRVKAMVEAIEKQGKTIIFETDDLVYDPAYLVLMDYYRNMNALEKPLYANGLGGEILANPRVEVATTTTGFLADKLREKGKEVFIVPNRLSAEDVAWADEARAGKTWGEDVIRVGYLSGTPSHDKDFATVTDALMDLLGRYPELRLVIVGPLLLEDCFAPYAAQIERLPFVPRHELFATIATLDICLAPLEIGNPFCESKSELKFFEAGIVGVPTVAAATRTFQEAIADGVDGFVAATTDEWTAKIERLVTDAELRVRMGDESYKTVMKRYTVGNSENEPYYSYLRNHIKKSV